MRKYVLNGRSNQRSWVLLKGLYQRQLAGKPLGCASNGVDVLASDCERVAVTARDVGRYPSADAAIMALWGKPERGFRPVELHEAQIVKLCARSAQTRAPRKVDNIERPF